MSEPTTTATTQDQEERVSMGTLHALADILGAAVHGRRITYALDDEGERVLEGVARALTQDGGGFFRGDNVLDAHLWVSGMQEHWLPVRDLVDKHKRHLFFAHL